jgi:hypothetical protein
MPPKKQSTLGSFWGIMPPPAKTPRTEPPSSGASGSAARSTDSLNDFGAAGIMAGEAAARAASAARGSSSWPTAAIDLTTREDETALNLGSDARTASALSTSARAVVLSLRVEAADGGARAKRNVRPIRPPAGKKRGRAELEDQRAFGGRNGSTWFASANVKA